MNYGSNKKIFVRELNDTEVNELKQAVFIVLDNFGPHKKDKVLKWAAENNIEFYFTPTNASWLNRIEPQFNPLKNDVLRNINYQNHNEIADALHKWLFFP